MNRYLCAALWLALVALLADPLVGAASTAAPLAAAEGGTVLLVNQTSRQFPAASARTGEQIELLLRHFAARVERTDEAAYTPGEAANFDRVVLIGNDAVTPLPAALLADLATLDRPTLWLQYGLEQLPVDLRAAGGFSLGYVVQGQLPDTVEYQGERYPAHPSDVRQLQLTSPTARVLASYAGAAGRTPYIVRGNNLWYVNGLPTLSAGQVDPARDAPALIFADALHEFFGGEGGKNYEAVLHVADVTIDVDAARLMRTAQYLYQQRLPYALSIIPATQSADGQLTTLRDRPELVEALRYAQAHGAMLVLQGDRTLTDGDYIEFWDPARGAPPSGETSDRYAGAVEDGIRTLRDVGLEPRMWETPHYMASPMAYQVFGRYFPYALENPGAELWSPYLAAPDRYGIVRIPVATGAIERTRGETVATQLQRAATLRIVRDSWMVGYYSPASTPLAELQSLITGLQRADYRFADLRAFPAQARSSYQPDTRTQLQMKLGVDLPIGITRLDRWFARYFPGWSVLQRLPSELFFVMAFTSLFLFRLREQWRPPKEAATSSVEQPLAPVRGGYSRRLIHGGVVFALIGIASLSGDIAVRNGAASSGDSTSRLRGWSDLEWNVKYDGYGTVGYSGDIATLEPQPVGDGSKTSAALAVAGDPEWRDYSFSVQMQVGQQLRQNTPPNPWETGWLFFRYQADDRAYYLAHKVNGLELGKLVPTANGSQVFLATTAAPVAEMGRWYDYRIEITGARIRVYVDGTLQIDYTDLDPIPSGRVGLYTEDARVSFRYPFVAPLDTESKTVTTPTAVVSATAAVPASEPSVAAEPTAVAAPAATIPAQPSPTVTAAASAATATRGGPTARRELIRFSTYQTDPQGAQIGAMSPGGAERAVLGAIPGHPWGPRFSPDGTRLLFSSAAPATVGRASDLDLNGTGSPDIWVANADGSQARRLTAGSAGYNGWSWSPDGRWVAFASNRSGGWDIYKMQMSDAQVVRLTMSSAQDGWPVWTPDGLGLVFVSTRSDRAQLYAMDANGGGVRRLLATATADTGPALAPDGRIAFAAQEPSGASEIYVLDRGAAIPRRLTNTGAINSQPAWSPDGTRLVFTGQRNGRSDVYLVNADGSGLVRLTTTGQNQYPDWGFVPARP